MSSSVEGFDELLNKLDKIGDVSKTIGTKALRAGAKIVRAQQRTDAPRGTDPKKRRGYTELKTTRTKTSRANNKYLQVGLTRGYDWEVGRGLWFQHYGFHNVRTGNYHPPTLWMDRAYQKVGESALETMVKVIQKEMVL